MQSEFRLTPKQAEYIRNAHHRWNVACGAVRSGKSYLQISYLIPDRLLERKEKRGLIVFLGATRDNIERNVLQPLRDIYGNEAATEINSKNFAKVLGVKVYCIGADKVSQVAKIRGSEISYCAIDEGIDINKDVFEMLKSRLSLPWSCCDVTTNPAGPNHWFKKFLDSRDQGVDLYLQEYTLYDNPFLPQEYVKSLEAEYAGSVWFDRYILGRWTLAEGLVYANYATALCDAAPADQPLTYRVSVDYGTSNPFAALLWELHSDGVWYCTHEYGYSGRETGVQLTDGQYLDQMRSKIFAYIPDHALANTRVIVDPSAASFIALLRQEGYAVAKANNDVLKGIRDTSTAMQNGLIKVLTTCKQWQEEAQSYRWDEQADDDRVIKEHDHFMDSMRYFVETERINRRTDRYSPVLYKG